MDERELGKLFIIGFKGTLLDHQLRDLMDEFNPSGVILFPRNIDNPVQVAKLTLDLQEHAAQRLPEGLFIGVDQEGGRVARFKHPFSELGPALKLASSGDGEAQVAYSADLTASELRLVGVNLNFAPVLDVLSYRENLSSTVIGDRAYGFDGRTVFRFGRIVILRFRSHGLIPCCKHFPGHGGTIVDSHISLPVDDRDRDTLASDLIPFTDAATILNVEMIMTAHVLFKAFDDRLPATLSPMLINALLREGIGYQGVVITDDLDMGAVADTYSPAEAALLAVKAGVDLLLFCHDPSKAFAARSRIAAAIKNGEISKQRIGESLERIRLLKARYPQSMGPGAESAIRDYFHT